MIGSVRPEPPIETLKRYLKIIEEGKLNLWLFIYPLHGISIKRWVMNKPEKEIKYDIGFTCPEGLTSDEMRFIAAKLVERADFADSLPAPEES